MEKGLSVCYIAKNEEKNISKSLEHLVSLMGKPEDTGYEILVLDTGSTDRTVENALKYGARVEHFTWVDDFSAARNEVMQRATYDRILFIDADEYPERIDIQEINRLWAENQGAVGRIVRRNICNSTTGGSCIYIDDVERLFDRREYRYVGTIHEQLVRTDNNKHSVYSIPFTVFHDGYFGTEQQLKEKAERNNKLLFKELEGNPDDPYILYQIGQSFELVGERDLALEFYEKGYRCKPDRKAEYSATMIHSYGCILTDMEKYDEAKKLIEDELSNYSYFADFLCFAAYTYMRTGELKRAIDLYNMAFDATEADIEGSDNQIPSYNLGCIYAALGDELRAKKYFELAGDYGKAQERLKELLEDDFEKKCNEKYISLIVPVRDDCSYLWRLWECIKDQSIGIGHLEVIFVVLTDSTSLIELLNSAEREYGNSVCLFYPDEDIGLQESISQAFGYTTAANVMLIDNGRNLKWDALRMMNAASKSSGADMVMHGVEYSGTDFSLTVESEQMRERVKEAGIIGNDPDCCLYRIDFLLSKGITVADLLEKEIGIRFADKIYCIKEKLEESEELSFTVIVPCYNGGQYIDVCMESLLAQSVGLNAMQIIIVDDVSDDGETREKLKKYEEQYPDNILLILNDERMGPGGCRNIAIRYATGRYTAYVDCDDWLDRNALEELGNYAMAKDADVVEFAHGTVYAHNGKTEKNTEGMVGARLYEVDSIDERKEFVLPSDSSVVCWDKLYRTELISSNDIRFAEGIAYEESVFSYMVRFYTKRYVTVPEKYYYYYKHPGSMSDIERYKKNRFDIVEGYIVLLGELKTRGLMDIYAEEAEFIFWCGAFYLPIFNMAAIGEFYTKDEYESLRSMVADHVNNICSNKYFNESFSNMDILGKITYLPVDDVSYNDIKQLFMGIVS